MKPKSRSLFWYKGCVCLYKILHFEMVHSNTASPKKTKIFDWKIRHYVRCISCSTGEKTAMAWWFLMMSDVNCLFQLHLVLCLKHTGKEVVCYPFLVKMWLTLGLSWELHNFFRCCHKVFDYLFIYLFSVRGFFLSIWLIPSSANIYAHMKSLLKSGFLHK